MLLIATGVASSNNYVQGNSGSGTEINWLVVDHLGHAADDH